MRRRTSLRGVREHCELRLLLEPHAAALAAERAARGGAAELAERVRGLDPLSPDDRVSFHLAIAEAAESEALPELIGGLNDLAALDEAYLGELEPSRAISSAGQEKILAAVEAGDAPAARRAMTEHLELIRDSMVAAVERGDDRERR
jgi:DNA-binding FadR family transcriptional regulator